MSDTRRALTLTASEIGSFAFCPQAWYLQRNGRPQLQQATTRQDAGIAAHQQIGHRVDLLQVIRFVQRLLLLCIIAAFSLLTAVIGWGWP